MSNRSSLVLLSRRDALPCEQIKASEKGSVFRGAYTIITFLHISSFQLDVEKSDDEDK